MSRRALPSRARRCGTGWVGRSLAGAVAATLLAVPAGTAPAAADEPDVPPQEPVPSDITLVQANIYTGLSVEKFQKDVAKVLALQPDFVTYNETHYRSEAVMAPDGYALWRDTSNRFKAETPVAWRTDRWTPIDQGVHRISNWRGKPPGRQVELGRRFVNWVTLQGVDGRVVSVVSAHVAPLVNGMPDLLRRSIKSLVALTDTLSAAGPVLVGGDFNVHYTSGRYPRDLLEPHGLTPTFDTLGSYFPTGDHHGSTIDYVYHQGSEELVVDRHYPVALKSDHDAVVADFSWTEDLEADSTLVRSNPDGDAAERLSVLRAMKRGIKRVEPGGAVRVVTTRLDLFALRSTLRKAAERGVAVRISLVRKPLSDVERKLRKQLKASGQDATWLRRCRQVCAQEWEAAQPPKSLMLTSDAFGTWTTRYDVERWLTSSLIERATRLSMTSAVAEVREAGALARRVADL